MALRGLFDADVSALGIFDSSVGADGVFDVVMIDDASATAITATLAKTLSGVTLSASATVGALPATAVRRRRYMNMPG